VINTKTIARGEGECSRAVDRFLRELDTDYLDVVLLHGLTSSEWTRTHSGAMEALSRAKEAGKVRAVGVSSHGIGVLDTASTEDWVDVILARINHAGVNMDGPPEAVLPQLERAAAAGKGVFAMKVLGCGALADEPERAIRYVMNLDCVHAMTIGFLSQEELRSAIKLLSP
jgi:predicted aldo/keto reductase-like oxidoreductase